MKLSFAIILSLFTLYAFSKQIDGIVVDAKTKERLPYVHIGILNKNLGVISTDDGKFHLDLPESMNREELVFSMLGYEIKKVPISELKASFIEVQLNPIAYQLKEVVVSSKKQKIKQVRLGRFNASRTTTGHSGTQEFGLGGEWGLRIFTHRKQYDVKKIQFHLRFNTVDSILFRINVYNVRNDLPAESILKKDLFVKSYKNQHWITRDLSSESIYLNEDVIVTYEVVRLWWDKQGDNQLFFTHGSGYKEGKSYSRESSQDEWKINSRPPIALFLTAEEY